MAVFGDMVEAVEKSNENCQKLFESRTYTCVCRNLNVPINIFLHQTLELQQSLTRFLLAENLKCTSGRSFHQKRSAQQMRVMINSGPTTYFG
jgi:hypothetical protein